MKGSTRLAMIDALVTAIKFIFCGHVKSPEDSDFEPRASFKVILFAIVAVDFMNASTIKDIASFFITALTSKMKLFSILCSGKSIISAIEARNLQRKG